MALYIWGAAIVMYGLFRLWYDGLRKPLSEAEIAHYLELMEVASEGGLASDDRSTARRFMEEDDGKEFIMVNLVEFNPSPVSHPDTGKPTKAGALLQEYTGPFLASILKRACHPVIGMRAVGGYLESWNTPADPGWHMAGLVRYRSRRDMLLSSVASESFADVHKYKIAAMAQTYAFPAQTQAALYLSPRGSVALVLALGAALLQLALG